MNEAAFVSGGVPIRYVEMGSGDPVVLIHGFSVHAERNWLAPGIAQALARDAHVVALDLRGHGRSGKPHEPVAYGLEILADLVGLLDHLGVEEADIVGYSTGAQVTLSFITRFPERVRRAVLGGGGMLAVGDEEYEWYRSVPASLSELAPDETIVDRLFPGAGLSNESAAVVNDNDPRALSAFATGMLELAHDPHALSANRIPVLFLIGEHDRYRHQAEAALRVGSGMQITVQEGCDHFAALRDPSFVTAVRDFFGAADRAC